jgi:hypothetical protein
MSHSTDPEALMDIRMVRQFFGNKSKMTIYRWTQNKELGFPQPMQIAGHNFWQRGDLIAFRDAQRRKSTSEPGAQVQQTGDQSNQVPGANLLRGFTTADPPGGGNTGATIGGVLRAGVPGPVLGKCTEPPIDPLEKNNARR